MMQKLVFFWGFLFLGITLMAQEGEVTNHI